MSEWREQANKRRDERQTKVSAIRPPGGSTKDTKRWCRGKPGREHQPACKDYNDIKKVDHFKGWKTLVCEACGKQMDHYFPSPFREYQSAPPNWITSASTAAPSLPATK